VGLRGANLYLAEICDGRSSSSGQACGSEQHSGQARGALGVAVHRLDGRQGQVLRSGRGRLAPSQRSTDGADLCRSHTTLKSINEGAATSGTFRFPNFNADKLAACLLGSDET